MSHSERRVELGRNDDGRRLDRVLRKLLPGESLGSVFRALRRRDIRLNGKRATPDARVRDGDTLLFRGPVAESVELLQPDSVGPAIDAGRIIHENSHVIVLNKLPGELTHGENSLLERVEAHWTQIARGERVGGVSFRPGPVHRLDRNTSGLVMFALSTEGAQEASRLLHDQAAAKEYLALLSGRLDEPVTWDDSLLRDRERNTSFPHPAGQAAHTLVEPLLWTQETTVALITIESGRTHQIRAHAAAHGHPLAGDGKYGGAGSQAYVLHAARLRLADASTTLGFQELVAPLTPHAARRLGSPFADELAETLARYGLERALP